MDKNEELIMAIKNDDVDKVKELIAEGVNINKQDKEFKTPLIKSIELERRVITDLLIESGAQLNLGNEWDEMPIEYAIVKEDYNAVKK